MSKGIDDILNGVDEPVEAPEAVEAPEPQAEPQQLEVQAEEPKAERPRGPDGKFIPKGETDASPASQEVDPSPIIAERKRRQEAERKAQELEARLQQLQTPPQPAPDMFENPEGWQSYFGQQITQDVTQYASLNAKLEMSEMLVAQAFDDFDDLRPKILEFMESNPAVRQEVLADRHPWARAYRMVKNAEAAKELGATDIGSLRATIEAEVRAKLEAEQKAAVPKPEIPDTLADAQSARGSTVPLAPPSLDQILGRAAA